MMKKSDWSVTQKSNRNRKLAPDHVHLVPANIAMIMQTLHSIDATFVDSPQVTIMVGVVLSDLYDATKTVHLPQQVQSNYKLRSLCKIHSHQLAELHSGIRLSFGMQTQQQPTHHGAQFVEKKQREDAPGRYVPNGYAQEIAANGRMALEHTQLSQQGHHGSVATNQMGQNLMQECSNVQTPIVPTKPAIDAVHLHNEHY